jgi:hypothetical protein
MKIRNGFVSNSSSSSFCVFGCRIIDESLVNESYPSDEELENSLCAKLQIAASKNGKEIKVGQYDYGDSNVLIGISPWSCRDDETMTQFKSRVVKTVKAFLKKNKVSTDDLEFRIFEETVVR